MKKSKRLQLGTLLGVMLLVSMAAVDAEPVGANLSNNTINLSNNTINLSNNTINLSNNTINLSNNTTPQEKKPDQNNTGIGELPIPVFREVVIVYFKEMPVSIEGFATKHGVKLIFIKQDIKMAAFETKPKGNPGETSQQTLDFITEVSKDSTVEKAFKDGFKFTDTKKVYSPKPKILDSEYYDKLGVEYVPNKVVVGFWRLPPSLEEFASKYGGRLMNLSYSNKVLGFASFETSNISEFINNISSDPYVEYVELDGIGHIASISTNNTLETTDTPKAPGLESILSIGLLISMVYIMRREKSN